MTSEPFQAGRGDVLRLFEGDSVSGLDEGELLDRFVTRRDEVAFEALVTRLGPMVLGVCRRVLVDPHDVDDAFQATFLVLVRKAGSIRDRDLVAPWLHGVALKVSRRARSNALRRADRERASASHEAIEGAESGRIELRGLIDEEIGRLSEPQRRAVLLCDVEGLTREEAALRLGWTLNMVRGRLERARGRLRDRLVRRGVAPTGAWATVMAAPPIPSPALMAATVRAALAFAGGRVMTGLASVSTLSLSQGVLWMMMLSRLKLGLAVMLSAGLVAGGSGLIAAQRPAEGAEKGKTLEVASLRKEEASPIASDPFRPRSAADLSKARIEAAQERYRTQLAFYQEGRITIDRLGDASRGLMVAELDAAGSKAERVEAAQAHHGRLNEILKKEEAELEVGRATSADVSEAKTALLDSEFALAKELEAPESVTEKKSGPTVGTVPADRESLFKMSIERADIARRLLSEAMKLFPSEISVRDFLTASKTMMDAEIDVATSPTGRQKAIRSQIERLRSAQETTERLIQNGEKRTSDGQRVHLDLLDAELSSAKEGTESVRRPAGDLEGRLSDVERKLDRLLNFLDTSKR